jgi:hypothetical protein
VDEAKDRLTPSPTKPLITQTVEKSELSTSCSMERENSSQSCDVRSISKSYKFRPRFADEGLEDLASETESIPGETGCIIPSSPNSEELDACMKVGEAMVRDIEQRQQVLASDLLRE